MKKFKKVVDILTTSMLVVFVLFVVLLVGVRLVGIEPHIVLSGSMEPEILTGSLVYVKPISPEAACELKEGDTVTYIADKSGTKVTHKIYEVVGPAYVKNQYGDLVLDDNGAPVVANDTNGNPIIMYTTYGINNKNESDPSGYTLDGTLGVGNLASSNVFGKVLFSIPFLGYLAHFTQNPPGRYITIIVCAVLLFTTFFSNFSFKSSSPKDKDDSESPSCNPEDDKNSDSEVIQDIKEEENTKSKDE